METIQTDFASVNVIFVIEYRISKSIIWPTKPIESHSMYPTGQHVQHAYYVGFFIAAITAFIKNSYSHLWWAQILSICENRWFERVWRDFPEVKLVKDPTLEAIEAADRWVISLLMLHIMDYQCEYCGAFCRTADDAALVDGSDCGLICCFRLQFARS